MADYILPKICRSAVQFLWNDCLQSEVFQCCQTLSRFHRLLLYAALSTLISHNTHTSNRTYSMVHKSVSLTCLTLFSLSNFSLSACQQNFARIFSFGNSALNPAFFWRSHQEVNFRNIIIFVIQSSFGTRCNLKIIFL